MSAAYINNFAYLKILTISLAYNVCKSGARQDPCSTKLETGNSLKCEELKQTSKVLLLRKLRI